MNSRFKDMLQELEINVTDEMFMQFDRYYDLLIEWNKVMNLTGITDYNEVVCKHFIDSLSIVKAIDIKQIESIIDIGTGAGFPGIPIKIVFPNLKVTLLDSLNKRVKFLNSVITELNLKDIYAVHGRAEEFAKKSDYREQYDLCVSRAVANLSTLSEYCLPYVKVNGYFIPYKSGDIDEELGKSEKAIKLLGGCIENTIKFELPETDIKRSLIMINKKTKTEKRYPRKTGLPAKEPLS